jgi:protein TonB
MAISPPTYRQDRINRIFAAALLLSLGLHVAVLAGLPKPSEPDPQPQQLVVELLQPPAPPPPAPEPEPPAPPKPPEPPKPKPLPKKPQPRPEPPPEPLPPPPTETPPAPEPPPPPPTVISAPPEPAVVPEVVVPPPPPEPPPKPKGPSDQELKAAYSSQLSREFAKYKQYPRIAQMRGWQGVARVELQIDASGGIQSLGISTSSGYEALDKQALEMVRKATPLPQPPEALRGREFTIIVPVAFRLE